MSSFKHTDHESKIQSMLSQAKEKDNMTEKEETNKRGSVFDLQVPKGRKLENRRSQVNNVQGHGHPMGKEGQVTSSTEYEMYGQQSSAENQTYGQQPSGENQMYGQHPSGANEMYGHHPSGENQMYGQHSVGGNQMYGQHPSGENQMYDQQPSGENQMYGQQASGENQTYGQQPSGENQIYGQHSSGENQMYGQHASGESQMYGQHASGESQMYGQHPGENQMYGQHPSAGYEMYDQHSSNYPGGPQMPGYDHMQNPQQMEAYHTSSASYKIQGESETQFGQQSQNYYQNEQQMYQQQRREQLEQPAVENIPVLNQKQANQVNPNHVQPTSSEASASHEAEAKPKSQDSENAMKTQNTGNSRTYCQDCDVSFKKESHFFIHCRGLAHYQRVEELERQAKKDSILPEKKELSIPSWVYCEPCDLNFQSESSQLEHIQTQQHQLKQQQFHKERKQMQVAEILQKVVKNNEWVPASEKNLTPFDIGTESSLHCEVCNVTCTGLKPYEMHMTGNKHLKKVKRAQLLSGSGKDQSFASGKADESQNKPLTFKKSGEPQSRIQMSFDCCLEPIIGADYVTEYHSLDPMTEVRFSCTLCQRDMDAMLVIVHLTGTKHRIKYMKYHYPTNYNILWAKKNSEKTILSEKMADEIQKREGRHNIRLKIEKTLDGDDENTTFWEDVTRDGVRKDLPGDKTSKNLLGFVEEKPGEQNDIEDDEEKRKKSGLPEIPTLLALDPKPSQTYDDIDLSSGNWDPDNEDQYEEGDMSWSQARPSRGHGGRKEARGRGQARGRGEDRGRGARGKGRGGGRGQGRGGGRGWGGGKEYDEDGHKAFGFGNSNIGHFGDQLANRGGKNRGHFENKRGRGRGGDNKNKGKYHDEWMQYYKDLEWEREYLESYESDRYAKDCDSAPKYVSPYGEDAQSEEKDSYSSPYGSVFGKPQREPVEAGMASSKPRGRQVGGTMTEAEQVLKDMLSEFSQKKEMAQTKQRSSQGQGNTPDNKKAAKLGDIADQAISLLTTLGDCMVTDESDAEVALQMSNALTQSLLSYRMKSLPENDGGEQVKDKLQMLSDAAKGLKVGATGPKYSQKPPPPPHKIANDPVPILPYKRAQKQMERPYGGAQTQNPARKGYQMSKKEREQIYSKGGLPKNVEDGKTTGASKKTHSQNPVGTDYQTSKKERQEDYSGLPMQFGGGRTAPVPRKIPIQSEEDFGLPMQFGGGRTAPITTKKIPLQNLVEDFNMKQIEEDYSGQPKHSAGGKIAPVSMKIGTSAEAKPDKSAADNSTAKEAEVKIVRSLPKATPISEKVKKSQPLVLYPSARDTAKHVVAATMAARKEIRKQEVTKVSSSPSEKSRPSPSSSSGKSDKKYPSNFKAYMSQLNMKSGSSDTKPKYSVTWPSASSKTSSASEEKNAVKSNTSGFGIKSPKTENPLKRTAADEPIFNIGSPKKSNTSISPI